MPTTAAGASLPILKSFTGPNILQIAMPMGGIGACSICLNGYGGLQDYAIRHKPATTAMPDGHVENESAFALLHVHGDTPVTRLVEGPMPPEKIFDQGLKGQGYRQGGHDGLPRFEECSFDNAYPFGIVHLRDAEVPLSVDLTGWSPLIPRDDVSSGIPCAVLDYAVSNTSDAPVTFDFCYSLSHLARPAAGWREATTRPIAATDGGVGGGVAYVSGDPKYVPTYGSAALYVAGWAPAVKARWFDSGWWDSISILWREVSEFPGYRRVAFSQLRYRCRRSERTRLRSGLRLWAECEANVEAVLHDTMARCRVSRAACRKQSGFAALPHPSIRDSTDRLDTAAARARCDRVQPRDPEIADYTAPGKRQCLGLGGLFLRGRLLPRLVHTCLELCAGAAASVLEYAIATWDPDERGGVFEPHHNTYDIEFWGADGMCGSIYAGALAGQALMAEALGLADDTARYSALAKRAAHFLDTELFNGEYYEQKVEWETLRERSFAALIADLDDSSPELLRVQAAEGPKYQYASGCLSDGMLGAWMAAIYGIDLQLEPEHVRRMSESVLRYNFQTCTWPRGGKPQLPFVYSDEVWTGTEHQAASHMALNGMIDGAVQIVEATRSRYDGRVRNPFNEYECGNYYARAMSSYALLGAFSGFRYSAVTRELWFAPKADVRPFRSFFSAASGFGTIALDGDSLTVDVIEGSLTLKFVHVTLAGVERTVACDATAEVGKPAVVSV
jgi:hypothetical protein